MKPPLKKLLFCCAAIMLAETVKAQGIAVRDSDYVVTNNGDTIACTISHRLFASKNIYTTMADTAKVVKIDASKIKEYYLHGPKEYYISVMPTKHSIFTDKLEPFFMEAIERGKINLFQSFQKNNMIFNNFKTVWYITKGPGELIEVKRDRIALSKSRKSRKNFFEEMIMDNKDVYDAYVADKKFSYDQIRSLIHLYNTGVWIQTWPKMYDYDE